MKSQIALDDVALFLAVADAGGLSGAARSSGLSVPTLSRRMTELERRTGRRLFHRGNRGYALTAEGRGLLAEAAALRPVSERLNRWRAGPTAPPRVRITAGLWTSRHLARGIGAVWQPEAGWMPEFVAANRRVDIARREADIGIRNARPDQSWLAGRKTATITYAVFGLAPEITGFVALAEGTSDTPSDRWLRRTHPERIVTTASDARLALDLALAGVGRIVMPCFAAAPEPRLVRLSEPIDEIAHDEWLVCHHDSRHDPPVRAALAAVDSILKSPERGL